VNLIEQRCTGASMRHRSERSFPSINKEVNLALDKHTVTICLLDDDRSVLRATSRLLSSDGWKVESFSDPIVFLRYALTHRPRVVVLDIRMPIMNGLEVQTQLRTFSPSTRVIVLTSKDDASVRSKAMEAGASAFFLKPVNDEEFLAGIGSAFSEN
jgi:FixJ family two-component response regulator